jgi:hypothetical protein
VFRQAPLGFYTRCYPIARQSCKKAVAGLIKSEQFFTVKLNLDSTVFSKKAGERWEHLNAHSPARG